MKMVKLTEENLIIFAAKHYDNPDCQSDEEFYEDLNRFKYIKRILRRYHKTQTINHKTVRLALNHIILIINVFGVHAGSTLLFYKHDKQLYPYLKTFLGYLHSLPGTVNGINTIEIDIDVKLKEMLDTI